MLSKLVSPENVLPAFTLQGLTYYQCHVCRILFPQWEWLRRHLRKKHSELKRSHSKMKLRRRDSVSTPSRPRARNKHMKPVKPALAQRRQLQESKPKIVPSKKNPQNKNGHLKEYKSVTTSGACLPVPCRICGERFPSFKSRNVHKIEKHKYRGKRRGQKKSRSDLAIISSAGSWPPKISNKAPQLRVRVWAAEGTKRARKCAEKETSRQGELRKTLPLDRILNVARSVRVVLPMLVLPDIFKCGGLDEKMAMQRHA